MDDLINRQAAIDTIDEVTWYHQNKNGEMVAGAGTEHEAWYKADDIYKALKAVPSADAFEVVRCRECKYFDSGTDEDGKLHFKCLGWGYGGTSEDDFCSHGERNDE